MDKIRIVSILKLLGSFLAILPNLPIVDKILPLYTYNEPSPETFSDTSFSFLGTYGDMRLEITGWTMLGIPGILFVILIVIFCIPAIIFSINCLYEFKEMNKDQKEKAHMIISWFCGLGLMILVVATFLGVYMHDLFVGDLTDYLYFGFGSGFFITLAGGFFVFFSQFFLERARNLSTGYIVYR